MDVFFEDEANWGEFAIIRKIVGGVDGDGMEGGIVMDDGGGRCGLC
jgi:hypothetical protein